tara:strand:- start:575 stop:820 length:246 start_codon:yes stop_codon:yes gene_type:complete
MEVVQLIGVAKGVSSSLFLFMVGNLNKVFDYAFFAKEREEAKSKHIEDLIDSYKGAFALLTLRQLGNPFQVKYESYCNKYI